MGEPSGVCSHSAAVTRDLELVMRSRTSVPHPTVGSDTDDVFVPRFQVTSCVRRAKGWQDAV